MVEAIRYCVRVTCKDGRTWIAHGANALPHFEQHRKSAVAYKNELLKHLDGAKCKVVRVRVTIEEREKIRGLLVVSEAKEVV